MLRAQREGGPRGFAHSWDLTRFASSLFPADCIALPAGGRRSRYTWCDLLEQFQEFAAQLYSTPMKPVVLPPGRARLVTKPAPIWIDDRGDGWP
jgi:hypothetical protein